MRYFVFEEYRKRLRGNLKFTIMMEKLYESIYYVEESHIYNMFCCGLRRGF